MKPKAWHIGQSLALALAASITVTPATARTAAQSAPANISISAQPLAGALEALAKQSGVDILFQPEAVRARHAKAVKGRMTVEQALERMLSGSGLSYTRTASGAIAVRPERAGGAAAERGQGDVIVTVRDGAQLLQGARVEIEGTEFTAFTGRGGRLTFRQVPAGHYRLKVSYQGKRNRLLSFQMSGDGPKTVAVSMAVANAKSESQSITVTGTPISDAEAAAFQRQKASKNLVNIVASDSIGRFPDQNVASALSRLPGISVERDQGQERYVNLRGAPSKWTSISFNGVNVISPEGRKPRFDMVPNAVVSSLVATKAITPDMPAESIAGNINIVTRSAFDYPGLKVTANGGIGYRDLGDGMEYDLGASVSDTFANDTLGFVLSASRYKRDQVTDSVESRYEYAGEAEGTAGENLVWARQTDRRLYNLERSNTSFSGRIDWHPDVDNEIFVSSIYTEFRDDERRDLLVLDFDDDEGCYADVSCGNTPDKGVIYGVELGATLTFKQMSQRLHTNTIGGDHYVDGWNISWRGNYTFSQEKIDSPSEYDFFSTDDLSSRAAVVYDWTGNIPKTHLYDTIDNGDGTYSLGAREWAFFDTDRLALDAGTDRDDVRKTKSYSARLDIGREIAPGFEIKLGGQFDQRTKRSQRYDTYVTLDSLASAGLDPITLTSLLTGKEFNGSFDIPWSSYLFDTGAAKAAVDNGIANGAGVFDDDRAHTSYYNVKETIWAGYIMGTATFDWGSIVGGVRFEQSENDGRAYGVIDGDYALLDAGSDHFGAFPSLHVNYDMTENQKLRFSFNSGLARADFDERAPNFEIDDTDEAISGGNPFVKPERTYGVDLYYENYLSPVGILSVGAFYKWVKNPITSLTTVFGSTIYDTDTLKRSEYSFDTDSNGQDGYFYGVEVAYAQKLDFLPGWGLPEWTGGFGVNTNLTLIDSQTVLSDGRKAPMNGASDVTYNASLYWERRGLSMRVNWQWRNDWLDSYDMEYPELDRYWAGVGRLSFGARYQVSDNVEWYLNANNLTDAEGYRYRGNRGNMYEVEKFGRSFMTGVRLDF